jgi:hypothetical protein
MDANTVTVLVAGIAALSGLLTGAIVAALGYRFSRALERDRQAREDANRWLADRRQLYARFLVAASDITDEVLDRVDVDNRMLASHPPIDMHAAEVAHQEIRLLAPQSVVHAVTRHTVALRGAAGLAEGQPDAPDETWKAGLRRDAADRLASSWGGTIFAFRSDLGLPAEPLETGEPQAQGPATQ